MDDRIRAAAERGEPAAMRVLGEQLLYKDDPFETGRGVRFLEAAAAEGDVVAARLCAVVCAAGVGGPQDWTAALGYLVLAADMGSQSARAQLRILANASAEGGDNDWRVLAAGIRLDFDASLPEKESLSDQPRLRIMREFLTPAACDHIISLAEGGLARAQVYKEDTGGGGVDVGRTNSEMDFELNKTDLVVLMTRERIAAATRLPTATMELAKVLHYAPGETFGRHFDYLDDANPAFAEELQSRGQRLATFLVYLNDDFEGGETAFPRIGLNHRGKKGDAFFFANVDGHGRPDPLTLHAGTPTSVGEKWVFSQWIRDRGYAPSEADR